MYIEEFYINIYITMRFKSRFLLTNIYSLPCPSQRKLPQKSNVHIFTLPPQAPQKRPLLTISLPVTVASQFALYSLSMVLATVLATFYIKKGQEPGSCHGSCHFSLLQMARTSTCHI